MKKERYFRDELRRLFMGYAIVPAVVFTALCVIIFLVVLLYGKSSVGNQHLQFVTGELDWVVNGYRGELQQLAAQPMLVTTAQSPSGRVTIFRDFYRAADRLGCEANLYILNKDRQLLLSSKGEPPSFFSTDPALHWGLMGQLQQSTANTEPVVRLLEPWVVDGGVLALGLPVAGPNSGYVVITLEHSQLLPTLDRADLQTVIADRFGWVYASSNYNFLSSSNQVVPELEGAGRTLTYQKQLYMVARGSACDGLLAVYAVTDIQSIVVSLTLSGGLIITALALMTLWVFLSTRKVTEKKTRDFYHILDVMEMAQNGNLESTIETQSNNEFRFIADAYNEMMLSLRRQMENNRKMTELVVSAQTKQLESQFNPHFLYNTLENIRYMCTIEPKVAQKMVLSLSRLLRYSMDSSQTVVTLQEDLQHLENYLTILRYRFNRRLSYHIDVEQTAKDCRIPKLLLQPMIENSVKYGFGQKDTIAVELKAYLHEGRLMLICRDDGVGIPQVALCELTTLLEQEENTSRHSGLYNIHRRIRLLYGKPYGVEIRSIEGHGTTLVVLLPAEREEATADAACAGGGG